MLTGIVLFRPLPEENVDKHECHLAMIVSLFGYIPEELRLRAPLADKYLDRKGILKNKLFFEIRKFFTFIRYRSEMQFH